MKDEEIAKAVRSIGYAITASAAPGQDETGGHVESLTEAVMGMTAALMQIASAIEDLAEAVREQKS